MLAKELTIKFRFGLHIAQAVTILSTRRLGFGH